MEAAKVIGTRITEARTRANLSQPELGDEMGRYLGKAWSRVQVSQIEAGVREVKGVELWALTQALQVPASYFFEPIGESVEFPGITIPAAHMTRVPDSAWQAIAARLIRIQTDISNVWAVAGRANQELNTLLITGGQTDEA